MFLVLNAIFQQEAASLCDASNVRYTDANSLDLALQECILIALSLTFSESEIIRSLLRIVKMTISASKKVFPCST